MSAEYITKSSANYKLTILVMFLGSLVAFGAEYCLQPVIPVLAEEFALDPATASLAMSCGTAGMAFSMLIIASVARRLERKKTMSIALIGAALLAIGMAVSDSFGVILAMRLLQGALLAGFPAMIVAYINEEFDTKIIGAVVGIYVSGSSLGGLIGRIMTSTLTDFFSWRYAVGIVGIAYLIIGILFWLKLPRSTNKVVDHIKLGSVFKDFKEIFHNGKLMSVYFVAFSIMGAFVCTYNFISYILIAEPYNLSQTAVGMVFTIYLVGTVASTVMGQMSDKYGSGMVLCLTIMLMLVGIIITLATVLWIKILGMAVFTYGFFGAHSTACGWIGKLGTCDKAQVSAVYMLFYYAGASVIGTVGGAFLHSYGWAGVVTCVSVAVCIALVLAIQLSWPIMHSEHNAIGKKF